MRKDNHINYFKTKRAFDRFMIEAFRLEGNISRHTRRKQCETLTFYVDKDTGHIVTWYRQRDPAAGILDAQYYHLYHKIPWQISGTA